MTFTAGAVVYAKDLVRVGRFYAAVADLEVASVQADHLVLESRSFQLVIVAIPPHIAETIVVESPPQRRGDTPVKLVLPVASIARARELAAVLGGELNGPEGEWRFQGQLVCDGHDPEGNVVQLRETSTDP